MPLTLEDIARMRGVSRSTVLRVIIDDPNVKESTPQGVLDVIRRINFQPNLAARGQAVGRTQLQALAIPISRCSFREIPWLVMPARTV